jgi:hypothetical protein
MKLRNLLYHGRRPSIASVPTFKGKLSASEIERLLSEVPKITEQHGSTPGQFAATVSDGRLGQDTEVIALTYLALSSPIGDGRC